MNRDNLLVHHCIAIGENAIADKSYEIVIKVGELVGRTIMTSEEHAVIGKVLRRMNFNPIQRMKFVEDSYESSE